MENMQYRNGKIRVSCVVPLTPLNAKHVRKIQPRRENLLHTVCINAGTD